MRTLSDLLRSVVGRPEQESEEERDDALRAHDGAMEERERRVREARARADAAAVRALEVQVTARTGRYYRGRTRG